jgi:hypothetical protein
VQNARQVTVSRRGHFVCTTWTVLHWSSILWVLSCVSLVSLNMTVRWLVLVYICLLTVFVVSSAVPCPVSGVRVGHSCQPLVGFKFRILQDDVSSWCRGSRKRASQANVNEQSTSYQTTVFSFMFEQFILKAVQVTLFLSKIKLTLHLNLPRNVGKFLHFFCHHK